MKHIKLFEDYLNEKLKYSNEFWESLKTQLVRFHKWEKTTKKDSFTIYPPGVELKKTYTRNNGDIYTMVIMIGDYSSDEKEILIRIYNEFKREEFVATINIENLDSYQISKKISSYQ